MGKRNDTKEQVVEIAAAMLREGGYAALSLDSIAQRLGIRTPSLYYHFPQGKEGLLLAVAVSCAHTDGELIAGLMLEISEPVAALRAVARYFSSIAGRHPYGAINASRRSLSVESQTVLQSEFASRVEDPLCRLIQRGIDTKVFRDCQPLFVVRAFILLMLGIDDLILDEGERASLPDRLVDLFVQGLLARGTDPTSA